MPVWTTTGRVSFDQQVVWRRLEDFPNIVRVTFWSIPAAHEFVKRARQYVGPEGLKVEMFFSENVDLYGPNEHQQAALLSLAQQCAQEFRIESRPTAWPI